MILFLFGECSQTLMGDKDFYGWQEIKTKKQPNQFDMTLLQYIWGQPTIRKVVVGLIVIT